MTPPAASEPELYLGGRCEVRRFADSTALAQSAAEAWAARLAQPGSVRWPVTVALSGGRIAAPFFAAFVAAAQRRELRLVDVHFFWADERCVPPNDPESNYLAANSHLLQPLGISASNVHRIRGELPPDDAAQAAAADLAAMTRGAVLDLIFLGMGEDGHVASLFPGESAAASESPQLYRAVRAPKPPPERVTLGYRVLRSANEVWVLASGEGKRKALAESLEPGDRTPLGRVLRERTRTHLFTDCLA